jgi:hypothetical protein
MSAPTDLHPTPALVAHIASLIRSGTFTHVAAEAAGLPGKMFDAWMERGSTPDAPEEYRDFQRDIRQAQAQARCALETKLFRDKPLDWLKHGPGKPGDLGDGWTQPARAGPPSDQLATGDLLALPSVQHLVAVLMAALAAYPEAQAAVVQALRNLSPPESSPGA